MNLPLRFSYNEIYSVLIDSLSEHYINGNFKIKYSNSCISYSYSGIVYNITEKLHYFTFNINWNHLNVPSSTEFIGLLETNNNTQVSLLQLNWLINTQNNGQIELSNGSVKLTTEEGVNLNNLRSSTPFPLLREYSNV